FPVAAITRAPPRFRTASIINSAARAAAADAESAAEANTRTLAVPASNPQRQFEARLEISVVVSEQFMVNRSPWRTHFERTADLWRCVRPSNVCRVKTHLDACPRSIEI